MSKSGESMIDKMNEDHSANFKIKASSGGENGCGIHFVYTSDGKKVPVVISTSVFQNVTEPPICTFTCFSYIEGYVYIGQPPVTNSIVVKNSKCIVLPDGSEHAVTSAYVMVTSKEEMPIATITVNVDLV